MLERSTASKRYWPFDVVVYRHFVDSDETGTAWMLGLKLRFGQGYIEV